MSEQLEEAINIICDSIENNKISLPELNTIIQKYLENKSTSYKLVIYSVSSEFKLTNEFCELFNLHPDYIYDNNESENNKRILYINGEYTQLGKYFIEYGKIKYNDNTKYEYSFQNSNKHILNYMCKYFTLILKIFTLNENELKTYDLTKFGKLFPGLNLNHLKQHGYIFNKYNEVIKSIKYNKNLEIIENVNIPDDIYLLAGLYYAGSFLNALAIPNLVYFNVIKKHFYEEIITY